MMYRLLENPRWTTEDRKRSLARRRAELEAAKEIPAPPAGEEPVTSRARPSRLDPESPPAV